MGDQIRGPGLNACPQCSETKTSYPQHWNQSSNCDYPTLNLHIHEIATGALMGDGSLEGRERAKLRVETTTRAFALWLYEQFGMAAGSVRRFPQDDPDHNVYRVSTIAHPEFNHYRDCIGTARSVSLSTSDSGRCRRACSSPTTAHSRSVAMNTYG
ncbi:hypothetical protein [Saliphagus infecundisoli]|uniref:Homing endonuclease LAGLIDADG domain-containing protein n=1 Tax=Saliphagus infecundisoli TaxID=1849069 RepID=A0ABD5QCI5_9EURY|nr:hypothetical protein [Saliphagus infecundisoli]